MQALLPFKGSSEEQTARFFPFHSDAALRVRKRNSSLPDIVSYTRWRWLPIESSTLNLLPLRYV